MDKWDKLRKQIRWRIGYAKVLAARAIRDEDWEWHTGQKGRLAEIETILAIMDELEATNGSTSTDS